MEKDQYFSANREYVNKAIECFTNVFKFYCVEMLKRKYGDDYLTVISTGPSKDKSMSNNESKHMLQHAPNL